MLFFLVYYLFCGYKHRRRRYIASLQSSFFPKPVNRIYPSPLGPKPIPGVPTICASYNSLSKNFHDDIPLGACTQR